MSTQKSLPVCLGTTKDRTRCGRRATPGEVLCHLHLAKRDGRSTTPLTEPSPFDPQSKLLKIAAKDGHQHQLQAIRILLEREKPAACATCAARAAEAPDDFEVIWQAVTDSERSRMRVLWAECKARFDELNEIKADVRARIGKAK